MSEEHNDMKDIRPGNEQCVVIKADTENQGRVYVVPAKHLGDDTYEPQSVLVAGNLNNPPFFGIGQTPGHCLKPGMVVNVAWEGQQQGICTHTIPTPLPPEKGGDFPVPASIQKILAGLKAKEGNPFDKSVIPELFDAFGKVIEGGVRNLDDVTRETAKKVKHSTNENKSVLPSGEPDLIKHFGDLMKNPLRDYKEEPSAGKKQGIPQSVGGFPTKGGNIKDPSQYIKGLLGKKGELIPNAFKMIENLKKHGAKGTPLDGASSVGGLDLINKALAGVAQQQSFQQGVDDDDFLCTLFKELFPDFQCRIDDVETEVFREWKIKYLASLQDEGETS